MVPLFALVVSFLLFWVFGLFGWPYFEGWHTPLQGAVAVMLLLAASKLNANLHLFTPCSRIRA